MILDVLNMELDGDTWEELCQKCYRDRYQNDHYTEIPADVGGDAGIEGFTMTGVVIQCYCPERNYSDNELYDHLRTKMTKDINKLLKKEYRKRLEELGVPIIKEWHFVIPYYSDSRIIQHAETKRKEVLESKKEKPEEYQYIDKKFKIIIKQAEDFKIELTRIIRGNLTDMKLNLEVLKSQSTNWSDCESEKVENITRKVKAVMSEKATNEDIEKVVNKYTDAYIHGMEAMRMLRVSYTEVYEDVYALEQSYKNEVELKTLMNSERSMNSIILQEILNELGRHLEKTCNYFTPASLVSLKINLISMWLADCSLQFR